MSASKFRAKTGQIDFSKVRFAPVINCVVEYRNRILIVRRSRALYFFPGYWNGISGFLDDRKSLRQKVYEEIREELGFPASKVKSISLGQIFHQDSPRYKKSWIVHPVLVEIGTDKIRLDWEADSHKWIKPKELKFYKTVPGFERVISSFFKSQ